MSLKRFLDTERLWGIPLTKGSVIICLTCFNGSELMNFAIAIYIISGKPSEYISWWNYNEPVQSCLLSWIYWGRRFVGGTFSAFLIEWNSIECFCQCADYQLLATGRNWHQTGYKLSPSLHTNAYLRHDVTQPSQNTPHRSPGRARYGWILWVQSLIKFWPSRCSAEYNILFY